jgi:aconitate hydratase
LGVKAVLVESYERIHRSNLIGMGVLPLEFAPGDTRKSLGLGGDETYTIEGIEDGITPRQRVTVQVRRPNGTVTAFEAVVRIDTPIEVQQYVQGGILPFMIRKLVQGEAAATAS